MEAFEHVVKVYLEDRGYVVTSGVKFPVARQTRRQTKEVQTHGYEVDLVAARYDSLLLGSVKSFFGSAGVSRQGFRGIADESRSTHFPRYTMFNDAAVRDGIINGASKRYGYPVERITMALFVGKFCRPDEQVIRKHLCRMVMGGGPVEVVGLMDLIKTLQEVANRKTYINDAVVMTLKVLQAAGLMRRGMPDAAGVAAAEPLFELERIVEDEEQATT